MDVEDLPDLTGWLHVEVWTLEEAAMLWAAIDPMDYPNRRLADLGKSIHPMQFKKALILVRAAKEAVCAGTLPFTDAWEERRDDQGNEWSTKVEFPKLPEPVYVSSDMTRVKQAAFLKWASEKKIPSVRQSLRSASSVQQPIQATEVVLEHIPANQSEPALLLAAPSPLDTDHPCHPPELRAATEVWTEVVTSEAYKGTKTPKTVITEVLNTNPKYAGISEDAKRRIAVTANWNKKGGPPKTPEKVNPPTPAE